MVALNDIDRKRRQWDRAYENDAIDLDEYKVRTQSLREQEEQLRGEVDELQRRAMVLDADAQTLLSLRQALGSPPVPTAVGPTTVPSLNVIVSPIS